MLVDDRCKSVQCSCTLCSFWQPDRTHGQWTAVCWEGGDEIQAAGSSGTAIARAVSRLTVCVAMLHSSDAIVTGDQRSCLTRPPTQLHWLRPYSCPLSGVWTFFYIYFFSISLTTGGWNSPVTSCNTQIIMWYLWRRKITQPVAGSSRREKRDCGVNGAEGKEDQLIVVFTTDPSASTCTGIRFPQVLFLPSTLWVFTYLHNEEEREDVPSMVAVVRWRLPKRSCVIIVKPVAV